MTAAKELAAKTNTKGACLALNIPRSSFYRWSNPRPVAASRRRQSPRALSPLEREQVVSLLNSERFQDQSPREVYATLLEEGTYLCSIRTMYRILSERGEVRERRNQLRHPRYSKPELLAEGPNEVWSWDITKLRGPQKWTYFYLYVILDIYSRYVVGWVLARKESASIATRLIEETVEKQSISDDQLTIHSDRGPSMTSKRVAQLLADLGVTKSHSRPHVSNDNPFSEAQFKTCKYRPEFPGRFGSQEDGLAFCRSFFRWYNDEHHHSGLALLTPKHVHSGQAEEIISKRDDVLSMAYAKHPERFVRGLPKAERLASAVWINPPKENLDDGRVGGPAAVERSSSHSPKGDVRNSIDGRECSDQKSEISDPRMLCPT